MRIHPPKKIQLILHCGAKVKQQPKDKLISSDSSLLEWKENNRAVITLPNQEFIQTNKTELSTLLHLRLAAQL